MCIDNEQSQDAAAEEEPVVHEDDVEMAGSGKGDPPMLTIVNVQSVFPEPRRGEVRRVTGKEYHANALHGIGANRQRIWKQQEAAHAANQGHLSITQIETACPESKVGTPALFSLYIEYTALHYQRLTGYYDERFNKLRFNQYRGEQRAINEAANIFFNTSKKYGDPDRVLNHAHRRKSKKKRKRVKRPRDHPLNPAMNGSVGYPRLTRRPNRQPGADDGHVAFPADPHGQHPPNPNHVQREHHSTPLGARTIIAFGDGTFDTNMKGHLPSSCKKILKELNRRAKILGPDRLVICMIGERHTSSMCSASRPQCRWRFFEDYNWHNSPRAFNFLYRVRSCETCGTRWHRDVNSARLIRYLFTYMQAHGDERPAAF